MNLNATIQSLRNLTFALQHEKKVFSNFHEWYGDWQEKMKNDDMMGWLNDSRVTIVHREDLKTKSLARVSIYHYTEIYKADIEIPIDITYVMIAKYLRDNGYIEDYHIKNDYVLKVERRWVVDTLPNKELLNALSYCYGFLNQLVIEGHGEIGFDINECDIKDELHKNKSIILKAGNLSCMEIANDVRTTKISLRTLQRLRVKTGVMKEDDSLMKKARERYNLKNIHITKGDDIISYTKMLVEISKNVLKRDKYHMPMFFLQISGKGMMPYGSTIPDDKSDKYVILEEIANVVQKLDVSGVITIFESWLSTDFDSLSKEIPIEKHKDIQECIFVCVITKEGIQKSYITPFKRDNEGDIIFNKTIISEKDSLNFLLPIKKKWEN